MTFVALYWKQLLLAGAILGLVAYAGEQHIEANNAKNETAEAKREFAEYKAAQRAAEAKQAREALAQTVANERRKEHADAQNAAALAAAAADGERMRVERDAAVSRFLSATAPASRCPNDQACFDRAEFNAAYRVLVGEVREVGRECTAVTLDLDSAKLWASER